MENLIPVVVIAFAFSMISERLANLTKLYLPSILRLAWSEPMLLMDVASRRRYVLLNLHLKQDDQQLEAARVRTIALLSLFWGILIAYLFSDEIKGALDQAEGIGNIEDSKTAITLGFGILFSFGSKFWHDLLDILLATKNIRQRVQDIDLETMDSAKEVEAYLHMSDEELLEASLTAEQANLEKTLDSKIRTLTYQYQRQGGRRILTAIAYLEEPTSKAKQPQYIPLPGSRRMVPLVIVGGLGSIRAQGRPGEKIRVKNSNFIGTFGGVVYREGHNSPYILTCGHNVTKRKISYKEDKIKDVVIDTEGDNQVKCAYLHLKDKVDIAFLKPTNNDAHHNQFGRFDNFVSIRQLNDGDEKKKLPVYFTVDRGGRREQVEGRIKWYALSWNQNIQYNDGKLQFEALIAVEAADGGSTPPTEDGDSGSICYDRQGRAIGLVTGVDNKYTYLQSMYDLAYNHKFTFDKPDNFTPS